MKKASAQGLLESTFSPYFFSLLFHTITLKSHALNPSIRVRMRKIFSKDSSALFFTRLMLGLLYALGFCAWLYVFALIAGFFTLDASLLAQAFSALLLSMLVLVSFSIWLLVPRAIIGYFGFFAGLLLFYWIGLSFRFSIAPFLLGFVCVGIGLVYATLFYLGLYFTSKLYRIASLFMLGIIAPFSFDWFVPKAWLAYSVFGVGDLAFVGIMCALALGLYRGRARKIRILVSAAILLMCIDWQEIESMTSGHIQARAQITPLARDIAIMQSAIHQDLKWEQSTIDSVLVSIASAIDSAIAESKQMIIFPETILPFVLNDGLSFQKQVLATLLVKSRDIAIVLGAFSTQGAQVHNSTYVFSNSSLQILHKVILAPFGEKIPLPDFLAKPLYRLFFGIENGLQAAKDPQDFSALSRIWRNAICYEGTSKAIYVDAPKHLVMISNNAWFYPSIEPFLQRVLLKYYARLHSTTIVHSANYSDSIIITPFVDDIRAVRILSHKE